MQRNPQNSDLFGGRTLDEDFSKIFKMEQNSTAKSANNQSVGEVASKELAGKLSHLDNLIDQLHREELDIREQLRQSCIELHNQVESIEAKQRKIQDCLKNLQSC